MEVILLSKVDNLGGLGDRVHVKPGYGRNFLIPTGQAVPATAENIAEFEERRAELEREAAHILLEAQARKSQIENREAPLIIPAKAGDEGKLFGSIGTADIADAALHAEIELHRSEIRLPEGPFRLLGDYEVSIHLHTDVDAVLQISVVSEE